jgi:hypothetical protein
MRAGTEVETYECRIHSVEPGYSFGYIQTIIDPTVMNICALS